jgi:hypothetical protein
MRSRILSRALNKSRNASSIAARGIRTLTLRQAQGRLFDPLPDRGPLRNPGAFGAEPEILNRARNMRAGQGPSP